MKYILSYKVAQSFNIGMDINQETTKRYIEAVAEALASGQALFQESYEYPFHAQSIITEHVPDSDRFFTYLDFKIESPAPIHTANATDLQNLRERISNALLEGAFDLVILWQRHLEAHIVFERIANQLDSTDRFY